jgi:hypothetical protein
VEVIEEKQGQQARGMGRWAGEEVFDQGEAVFAEVNGVHACYGIASPEQSPEQTQSRLQSSTQSSVHKS